MDNSMQPDMITSGRIKHGRPEPLRDERNLYIGIDIGSTSSDIVVLDDKGQMILCDYKRTKGRPIETAHAQLKRIFHQLSPANIVLTSATGAAARVIAKLLNIPFINEVSAQAAAICHLYPQFQQATVIEMGGQDSKLIFLATEKEQTKIKDFALNTVCAAGTGSFLDQQAARLGINIEEEFGQLALESETVPRMAGRCSVFAKSDMIHLQQQATPTCDIIAGLCLALAGNLKSNLGCGREFTKPIIFTGGVAANIGVVRALEKTFELSPGQLVVPKEHFFTGAIGAILVAKSKVGHNGSLIDLKKIDNYLTDRGSALKRAPRRQRLPKPTFPPPKSPVLEHLLTRTTEPIDAYLGVDVGSLSTNVVVIDEQKRVLAKAYLMTAGQPLEAVRQGLDMVGKKVVAKVRILGAATTGSGRYLTGDFIGADMVINEITAQAAGAAIVNPKVDTIFEIGGQDSKYISLEDGVVVDFEMNHACAAGTGSFLEEQAQRLGINIKDEFAQVAFKSDSPLKLGERCTVFMESDLLSYQQQGAEQSDLVAGLSYSIVTNYLNRVVGRRKIGNNICFQGGTAFNKAVWSAFEKVTGKSIMVPDHHEVTGALGAAAMAAEYMKNKSGEQSKFRGFENLTKTDYSVESFTCEHCPNNCEIKKVQLASTQPLYYGSRCDRYNLKDESKKQTRFDAFGYRKKMLLKYAGLKMPRTNQKNTASGPTIGIPMSLTNWQLLPLFAQFFKALGFEIILSGQTDKQIIRRGLEAATAQPCFPVKVAYGHIAELVEKQVDHIFLPGIVSMPPSFPENEHNQLCPYVQSIPYQAQTAFGEKLGKTKILTAPVYLGQGNRLLRKSFSQLGRQLNVGILAIKKAITKSLDAQRDFEKSLRDKGREILAQIGPDEKLFVLVCRPYNGCDEGTNLRLPTKLADLGIEAIPMDMLELAKADLTDPALHSQIYWSYGQKILRAAEIIKKDPRLFAIYLSNFSCGPDSFLLTFFKDTMSPKPCLQLELDEHSADAGVITRLEAFLESLKHYHPKAKSEAKSVKKTAPPAKALRKRTLYIPYMSDCSYGFAACFRAYDQPAAVMPMADESTLLQGREYTTGKECLPCAITTGDMLKVIKTQGPDHAAFFMPASSGPCRFGMYNCMHKLVLKEIGVSGVPVISPNQDSNFYREFAASVNGATTNSFMKDMWAAGSGVDLLRKLILRIRPYAKDPSGAEQVYRQSLKHWIKTIEQRKTLSNGAAIMESIAEKFSTIELDSHIQKPRIGIVGEIYVRSHPFANNNVIARLEALGAACDLTSLSEWIYYINFTRSQKTRRQKQYYHLFTSQLQNFWQHKIDKKLAAPLEKRFGQLAEDPIEHVIELAKPYLHSSFEGEAVLSVGKIIEFHNQGFGGVINVMPFGCMPSTVVSTQTMRISGNCDGMPILNLSFDGQEDATLTTRLEAFVEQVRQRNTVSCAEFIAV